MDLHDGLRDGSAIACVVRVLDRSTKVDQWTCFVQENSADVLNEMDTPVSLVALLCNAVQENYQLA